jgi:predicted acetyltransferase
MADIEIVNPVPIEECLPWHQAMAVPFLQDPLAPGIIAGAQYDTTWWAPERHWGARADGQWVGTLGSLDRTLTIPGGDGRTEQIAADALTWVTVAATHRRRGILTGMLRSSLDAAKDRGDTVSILIAAEWPIYGRFGYAVAETTAEYSLFPRARGGAVPFTGVGSTRQVSAAELSKIGPALHAQARTQRAGEIDRPPDWWGMTYGTADRDAVLAFRVGGRLPVCIVHYSNPDDGPAEPDGYLAWTPVGHNDLTGGTGSIVVSDLVATSGSAYRGLWEYLTGIDLIGEIRLTRRAIDEPARWLLPDGRALRQTYAGDGTWLRMLDVPAALAARRYRSPDRLVLDIIDEDGGYAAGRVVLDGGPDGATCERAPSDNPDLRLSHRAVASAYLGGFSLRQLSIAVHCEELTPGARSRFDRMFSTDQPPWTGTIF